MLTQRCPFQVQPLRQCSQASACGDQVDLSICPGTWHIPTMTTSEAASPLTTSLAPSSAESTADVSAASAGTTAETALRALLKRTGYPLVQENGQRRYGPPPSWPTNKPPPARGCEVFVGKIPRDCFEVHVLSVDCVFASLSNVWSTYQQISISNNLPAFD